MKAFVKATLPKQAIATKPAARQIISALAKEDQSATRHATAQRNDSGATDTLPDFDVFFPGAEKPESTNAKH